MIDEPKPTWLFFPIDGFVVIDFDKGNTFLSFGALSPFSLCDEFPLVLSDFLPCSQRDFGK